YPELTLFAALLLVSAWQWARARRAATSPEPALADPMDGAAGRSPRSAPGLRVVGGIGARVVVVAVVLATIFQGLAFMSIYTRPVTRVTASPWIYDNIPSDATVAFEHWDDRLPLGLPGKNANMYKPVELTLYDEETPDKRTQLISKLDQADYIILSSNRLYGSIPRSPRRFPLATRYYQALFDGELGFEPIKEFTS